MTNYSMPASAQEMELSRVEMGYVVIGGVW